MPSTTTERIYGPILLGALFCTFFSGITTLQAVVYFRLYSRDLKFLKPIAISIWILDLVHTAFIWDVIWFYLIQGFGDISQIGVTHFSIPVSCIATTLIMFITHLFFIYRIFRLSKKYWLSALIFFLAFASVVLAFFAAAMFLRYNSFPVFYSKYGWTITAALSMTCATEVVKTFSMFILLRKSRRRSESLNSTIDLLVLYTLQMGFLAECFVIGNLICWIFVSNKLIFLGTGFLIAKFYANSVFATLNVRYHLRDVQSDIYEWPTRASVSTRRCDNIARVGQEIALGTYSRPMEINVHCKVESDEQKESLCISGHSTSLHSLPVTTLKTDSELV